MGKSVIGKQSKISDAILEQLPSPCWLLEEHLLEENLLILKDIKERSGVKILLALKGFALWHSFSLIGKFLSHQKKDF